MPADPDRWLDLLLQANVLKTTPRTGWHQRWVAAPENVAAHSWGAAMIALVLAEMTEVAPDDELNAPIDRGRLLSMAILHDLAEAETSDIPRSALRYLPADAKQTAEASALAAMLEVRSAYKKVRLATPAAQTLLELVLHRWNDDSV